MLNTLRFEDVRLLADDFPMCFLLSEATRIHLESVNAKAHSLGEKCQFSLHRSVSR